MSPPAAPALSDYGCESFVPQGAKRRWPFVVGTSRAYCPPPWNARLLLWRGILEALLGIQPTEPREHWKHLPRELLATLMHKEGAGQEHPSRAFVAALIREGESVLDVGCGAGAGYEVLAAAGRASRYVGVDSSEPSIDVARALSPAGDFRVGNATALLPQFGAQSFDVVVVRHVLEHLPDFELAMEQAVAVAGRLAVFVFFLTPRALPFGLRKLDPGLNRPDFYTYIYSRPAIDRFLTRAGLDGCWRQNVGVSRAGWLANENNSVLVVSRSSE